jgi:CHAT domain-containing protein
MYLADRYTISYAQSATSLTLLRTLKKEDNRGQYMFVMADPIFDENDDRIQRVTQKGNEIEVTDAVHEAISDWKTLNLCGPSLLKENTDRVDTAHTVFFNRLPETSELAKKIQEVYVNKTQVLVGRSAKEDYISLYPVSQFRYLTFATHGILDKTIPYIQEPALVLTQVNKSDTCDGFFTMSEVMGLNLQADVVALTACETGLGENVSGEGVMGMGRAFQYAGARNVFVSLWSVAESSSTELTLAFFQHINNGKEPVDAIQLARQEVRQRGYEHPFYWGAFILFGE